MSIVADCTSHPAPCVENSPQQPSIHQPPSTLGDVSFYIEQSIKSMNKGLSIINDMRLQDSQRNKEGEKCQVLKEIKTLEDNKENSIAVRNTLQEMTNNINKRYDLLISLGNLGQLLSQRNKSKDIANLEKAIFNFLY